MSENRVEEISGVLQFKSLIFELFDSVAEQIINVDFISIQREYSRFDNLQTLFSVSFGACGLRASVFGAMGVHSLMFLIGKVLVFSSATYIFIHTAQFE